MANRLLYAVAALVVVVVMFMVVNPASIGGGLQATTRRDSLRLAPAPGVRPTPDVSGYDSPAATEGAVELPKPILVSHRPQPVASLTVPPSTVADKSAAAPMVVVLPLPQQDVSRTAPQLPPPPPAMTTPTTLTPTATTPPVVQPSSTEKGLLYDSADQPAGKWMGGKQIPKESLLALVKRYHMPNVKVFECSVFSSYCGQKFLDKPPPQREFGFSVSGLDSFLIEMLKGKKYKPLYNLLATKSFTPSAARAALMETESDPIDVELPTVAVLKDYSVAPLGDVMRLEPGDDDVWLAFRKCTGNPKPQAPSTGNTRLPKVNSVVVISQWWCHGFYHFVLECWVRLGPVLDLLKRNPDMLVHTSEVNVDFVTAGLALAGVSPHRVLNGWIQAKTIYLPEPVRCGNPGIVMLDTMRRYLQATMHLAPARDVQKPVQIVLIHRSTSPPAERGVVNFDELASGLRHHFPQTKLTLFEGWEGFEASLRMFSNADIVVAPHGAGLSNLIAARKSTRVVEIMGPNPNLCFLTLGVRLGLAGYHLVFANMTAEAHYVVPVPTVLDVVGQLVEQVLSDNVKDVSY